MYLYAVSDVVARNSLGPLRMLRCLYYQVYVTTIDSDLNATICGQHSGLQFWAYSKVLTHPASSGLIDDFPRISLLNAFEY
jgi:hypothetical protein